MSSVTSRKPLRSSCDPSSGRCSLSCQPLQGLPLPQPQRTPSSKVTLFLGWPAYNDLSRYEGLETLAQCEPSLTGLSSSRAPHKVNRACLAGPASWLDSCPAQHYFFHFSSTGSTPRKVPYTHP